MERRVSELGEAIAHDAINGSTETLEKVQLDVRRQVVESITGRDDGREARTFLAKVERGEVGVLTPTCFAQDTPAHDFACIIREGEGPDASPIAARVADWIASALADAAMAKATAHKHDGVFVARPAHEVIEAITGIGLRPEVGVHALTLGAILKHSGSEGRDFVLACRREGFDAAMATFGKSIVVPVAPTHLLPQLDAAGLFVGGDVACTPHGKRLESTEVRPMTTLGRVFVGACALSLDHGLASARRYRAAIDGSKNLPGAEHTARRPALANSPTIDGETIGQHEATKPTDWQPPAPARMVPRPRPAVRGRWLRQWVGDENKVATARLTHLARVSLDELANIRLVVHGEERIVEVNAAREVWRFDVDSTAPPGVDVVASAALDGDRLPGDAS